MMRRFFSTNFRQRVIEFVSINNFHRLLLRALKSLLDGRQTRPEGHNSLGYTRIDGLDSLQVHIIFHRQCYTYVAQTDTIYTLFFNYCQIFGEKKIDNPEVSSRMIFFFLPRGSI